MTSDNRTPRKRRRRNKRRPGGAEGHSAVPNGNGPAPGNQQPAAPQEGGGGYGRNRRRRSRHRGRPRAGQQLAADGTPIPMEAPSGELLPTSGVLYLKANGSGL